MIKRLFDIGIVLIFLPLLLPLTVIISTILFIIQGTPIIFIQNRVGKDNKIFKLYKFRTMEVTAAEDFHKSHYFDLAKGKTIEPNNAPLEPIRIENDDRITSLGRILRRASLDELPNILNVIMGDMSLVGPRPLFEEDTKLFEKKYMRRLNVLPGITGLLQINERNTSEFSIWYKYDLSYIENWSLLLDLQIILKTPVAIFRSKIIGK